MGPRLTWRSAQRETDASQPPDPAMPPAVERSELLPIVERLGMLRYAPKAGAVSTPARSAEAVYVVRDGRVRPRRILAPSFVAAVLMPAWPVVTPAVAGSPPAAAGKADPTILGTIAFRHSERVQPRRPGHRGRRRAERRAALLHGQHGRRRLANDGRRHDLDEHLRRLLRGRVHRRPRRRRIRSRTSSTPAPAPPVRAATFRPASACTSRATPARPGSTSACARPA